MRVAQLRAQRAALGAVAPAPSDKSEKLDGSSEGLAPAYA